jgi:hypothetical protein
LETVAVLKISAHSEGGKNGYKANFIKFDRYFDGHAVKNYTHILATFFYSDLKLGLF